MTRSNTLIGLEGKDEVFFGLVARGWEPEISVFWMSDHGHGGPVLTPPTMARLAALGTHLWIDFYDSPPDEEAGNE